MYYKNFTWEILKINVQFNTFLKYEKDFINNIYDINTIIKYFPNTQQLLVHGPSYSWAIYIKVNDESEFDATYLYLIQLYKDHEHI